MYTYMLTKNTIQFTTVLYTLLLIHLTFWKLKLSKKDSIYTMNKDMLLNETEKIIISLHLVLVAVLSIQTTCASCLKIPMHTHNATVEFNKKPLKRSLKLVRNFMSHFKKTNRKRL